MCLSGPWAYGSHWAIGWLRWKFAGGESKNDEDYCSIGRSFHARLIGVNGR